MEIDAIYRLGAVAVDHADLILEPPKRRGWPSEAVERLAALHDAVGDRALTLDEAAASFRVARRGDVERHLGTLEVRGVVVQQPDGRYRCPVPVAIAA